MGTKPARDNVDVITEQWAAERPDLDTWPMEVVGRISRASRLLERGVKEFFDSHDVEPWEFDVLATLRRAGSPYRLRVGQLVSAAMVSSPALTNRLDRLVAKGLVERAVDPGHRRSVVVTLTAAGLELVEDLVAGHVANEARLLEFLSPRERADVVRALRRLLVGLRDVPDP